MTGGTASTGPARATTLVAAALLPLAGLAAVAAAELTRQIDPPRLALAPVVTLIVLSPGVVGLLILRQHPRHRVGWLLSLQSFLVGLALSTPPAHPSSELGLALGQVSDTWWVFFYFGLVMVAYVFPTGDYLSRRWRAWVILCLAGYAGFLVGGAGDPTRFAGRYPGKQPPLPTFPTVVYDVLELGGIVLVAASLVGAVVSARRRLRGATGVVRLQMLWFSWAALLLPLVLGLCFVEGAVTGSDGAATIVGVSVLGLATPALIGIAILRHRLFDIEVVLSRTLVYASLTAAVVGVYAALLWGAERITGNGSWGGLFAIGVVAVIVQPAHAWLRRHVDHWVYGDRHTPELALRRMSERVEGAPDTARVLDSVTVAVADALRVERVWIEPDGVADRDDTAVRVPLVHRGARLGDLAVSVPRGRTLSAADLALLHDLARHAAVVLRAARLTEDLQASRAQLVTTREEERRRLRRDLHDGLGPSLAAVVLKLNAAQRMSDEGERGRLLAETRAETRAAIAEVRRLVDDLRPPAIDEVGLIGAIRQRAAALCVGNNLSCEITGPARLPVLPAAVEVAAYRIASEALTNVVRHAGATRCHVRIAVNGAFELTITDNGRGLSAGRPGGVGWTSMSERAAELGGTCTVSKRADGLIVRAVLPLPSTDAELVAP